MRQAFYQFIENGYKFRASGSDKFVLNVQNSSNIEKPGSGHRVNFYYYKTSINRWLGDMFESVCPQLSSSVLWAPGIMGSYERWEAVGGKEARMVLGSQLDIGLNLERGGLSLHSYVGMPVKALEGEKGFLEPEWELGIRYTSIDRNLFVGTMVSSSIFDLDSKYAGALLRWKW